MARSEFRLHRLRIHRPRLVIRPPRRATVRLRQVTARPHLATARLRLCIVQQARNLGVAQPQSSTRRHHPLLQRVTAPLLRCTALPARLAATLQLLPTSMGRRLPLALRPIRPLRQSGPQRPPRTLQLLLEVTNSISAEELTIGRLYWLHHLAHDQQRSEKNIGRSSIRRNDLPSIVFLWV